MPLAIGRLPWCPDGCDITTAAVAPSGAVHGLRLCAQGMPRTGSPPRSSPLRCARLRPPAVSMVCSCVGRPDGAIPSGSTARPSTPAGRRRFAWDIGSRPRGWSFRLRQGRLIHRIGERWRYELWRAMRRRSARPSVARPRPGPRSDSMPVFAMPSAVPTVPVPFEPIPLPTVVVVVESAGVVVAVVAVVAVGPWCPWSRSWRRWWAWSSPWSGVVPSVVCVVGSDVVWSWPLGQPCCRRGRQAWRWRRQRRRRTPRPRRRARASQESSGLGSSVGSWSG